ncbi:unnamed protein product [Arabidopsis halleri]
MVFIVYEKGILFEVLRRALTDVGPALHTRIILKPKLLKKTKQILYMALGDPSMQKYSINVNT